MTRITDLTSYADMLVPGIVLWRPVVGDRLIPMDPKKARESGWMLRMELNGFGINEPVISGSNKGLVCIAEDLPPADTTHFLVTGVSKKLRQPISVLEWSGNVVFIASAKPYPHTKYLNFFRQMVDSDGFVDPPEKRQEEIRLANNEHEYIHYYWKS